MHPVANPHYSGLLSAGDPLHEGLSLVLLTLSGVFVFLWIRTLFRQRIRRAARGRRFARAAPGEIVRLDDSTGRPGPASMADPRDQMIAIASVPFETVPLLNKEEFRLLPLIEAVVRAHGDGHRVMAQTSLGELIRPSGDFATTGMRRAAHASINSKRLDFAIVDRRGHMAVAIEYHGSGHYHGTSFMRDAVKREAIRKAGVPFLEVPADFVAEEIAQRLREILVPTRVPFRQRGRDGTVPADRPRPAAPTALDPPTPPQHPPDR